MMVVLTIIGIMAGAASLSLFPQSQERALHREAQRLAWLLPLAQAQARVSGRPLAWRHDEAGYRFEYLEIPGILPSGLPPPPLPDLDAALRPRSWETDAPPRVRVEPEDAALITGEWMPGPMHIELGDGWRTVLIVRDAAGRYGVRP